jgi:hypothetical protein
MGLLSVSCGLLLITVNDKEHHLLFHTCKSWRSDLQKSCVGSRIILKCTSRNRFFKMFIVVPTNEHIISKKIDINIIPTFVGVLYTVLRELTGFVG